jgi:transketolase
MAINISNSNDLDRIARRIRYLSIDTIYKVKSGHIGPALSIIEIISILLFQELNWKKYLPETQNKSPEDQWKFWHDPALERDRFVLSKGHAVPAWYTALAVAGYIDQSELLTLRVMESRLQGHPERKRFPFIDATTGSLGQGQSEAMGYALAKKYAGRLEKVFCIIGDGESNEGQVWETAMAAAKFKLDNLILFVDFNKKQGEGTNKEVMDIEPLDKKWQAFNWHTQRINGHDFSALRSALEETKNVKDKPHVIICDTEKGYLGKDRLFMNGQHNPVIDEQSYNEALKFLNI